MNDLNILKPTSGSTEVPLLYIGDAQDLSNTIYTVSDNSIFRITALLDSRIWYYNTIKSGSGLFVPAGTIIEIPAKQDWKIEISGSVNLCKYII